MKIYKFFHSNKVFTLFNGYFEKELENFVAKSKYKYKIIHKNKIFPLQGIFQINEIKIEKIKFKLICYNHIKEISRIFYYSLEYNAYKFEKFKKNMNMNRYIDYFHEKQKLIYNIDNEDKIKIFGEEFIINNRNKLSIIYKDNIIPLSSYFLINDINKEDKENKKFQILLLELENISDRSYMFYDCKSLVKFAINKSEIKDKPDEKEKNLNCEVINKDYNLYQDSMDKSTVNENTNNSSKDNIKYFLSEFKKVNNVKGSYNVGLKNMCSMFYGCSSLISLPDISKWNTNNVKHMNSLFFNCSSLIFLPDISKWNTDKVNNMSFMFYGCSSLKFKPDISNWNLEKVKEKENMFD